MADWSNNEEIKIFQEYLRIPSVHPDIDFEPCIEFIRRQATSMGLPLRIFHPSENPAQPVVVVTWLGSEPQLPSLLLTSHMDVVPVYAEHWTHPPFGAEIDATGKIYARGTQDMKSVATQYMGAVRALQKVGVQQLRRTVHILFTPDEEIGSALGMGKFTATKEFKDLNIGFSLDEGIPSADDSFAVFYAERTTWKVEFRINGNTGHGSLLLANTVGEKLAHLMAKLNDFRDSELKRLDDSNGSLDTADVTTVNMTLLNGGVQLNVVPATISVTYDVRLAIDLDLDEFENQLKRWANEAGSDIEVVFVQKEPFVGPTNLSDSNPFWTAFKAILTDELGHQLTPIVCVGGTDSRFIRASGIPAIGFSPINNSPILAHCNDEYLEADMYVKGIAIYRKLIEKLANL